ncbi:hypothetical protein [Granulicella arctica]|uniref:hypothetical protein n=1 Tax=Granulicella arctica TaxID=940613 RepID=UPI0021E02983|nr:hypothetical protein [Granulicella arctica]
MTSAATSDACADLPHADHPRAFLSNGKLDAVLFLPDPVNGYYRSSRFDWAGVIGCVSLKGHRYFGEWFPHYDPLLNDSITGPAEEFRTANSELGYDDSAVGGIFLKIGVGVLRRTSTAPYSFGTAYPIVDTGTRSSLRSKRSMKFTQLITTDFGYSYRYEKTVKLDKHGAVLTLEHTLTNLGSKAIITDVYDHDFFMLDNQPTGAGMTVTLGFPVTPDKAFSKAATVSGKSITFNTTPERGDSPQGYLTGYTGKRGEYRIALEDKATRLGIEQTSQSPLAKFYFWSTPKTICPEAYIHINVAPGKTQTWQIRYSFKAD